MKKLLLFASVLCSFILAAGNQVKIIDLSWSNPTVQFLQKHLADMERDSPGDGVCIRIYGDRVNHKGRQYYAKDCVWTTAKLEFKHFEKDIESLKKLPFKKFTDNFFWLTTYYYDLDWYNDADWEQSTANFGVAAKVCRAAGLKGIWFDIEEYGKRFLDYWKFKNTDVDFKTTSQIAYKRGQQWGREVFRNYPEITLFMPYMFSLTDRHLGIPFINGIINVMPPTAKIIEGYELNCYHAGKPEDYIKISNMFYRNADLKATPENRAKYLNQVEFAPGYYLDGIFRDRQDYFKNINKQYGGACNFMRLTLAGALEQAKSYIWMYGECGCWWKNSSHPKAKKTWEEQVPGITQAIRESVSDKLVFKKDNLLKNPELKDGSGWYAWQFGCENKKNKVPGTVTLGNGKAVLKNVLWGCISQGGIKVNPGEYYRLQFRGANRSNGTAYCQVAFKDKKGNWLNGVYFYSVPLPATGKFENVSKLITVPSEAASMTVQLSAKDQGRNDAGEIIYTGAQITRLPVNY